MQKAFINQGLSVLTDILSDLQIKNIFIVIGTHAYPSIKTLIEPYIQGISVEFFCAPDSNVEAIISGCEQLRQCNSDLIIAIGGGRIIGEACHFVDLLRFLAGCKIDKSSLLTLDQKSVSADTISINLLSIWGKPLSNSKF